MSGHSKWHQIRHKKTISDQKKGQIFSKLAKLISVAAKDGTDPETNPKLKSAIEKAREFNLPNENIQRAIKRAGSEGKTNLEKLTIEAIGPSNIAILIEVITDNKNRALAEIKNILSKNDSKMAASGSLIWQFDQKGVIYLPIKDLEKLKRGLSQEDLELQIIEAGAEDISKENDRLIVYTKPEDLYKVKTNLQGNEIEVESAGLEFIPKIPIKIEDIETKTKLNRLFELLDENDDVSEIYSNAIL